MTLAFKIELISSFKTINDGLSLAWVQREQIRATENNIRDSYRVCFFVILTPSVSLDL